MHSQTQNQAQRRNAALASKTRAILVERFPNAFRAKGAPKHPLKLNIDIDIRLACPDIKRYAIEFALRDYTSGPTYLRNMVEGAPRLALNGDVDGAVSASAASSAKRKLIEFEKRVAAEPRKAA